MDKSEMTERILNLTLEIIYLLTGEDCIVVKKSGELVKQTSNPRVSKRPSSAQCHLKERNCDQKILELTNKIIHPVNEEVSTDHDDIVVSLSVEKLDCMGPPKDLQQNKMMENHHRLRSLDFSESRNTNGASMSSQDCLTEDGINRNTESSLSTLYEVDANCVKVMSMESKEKTQYPSTHIKEESVSCDGGDLTSTDIYIPTDHTQYTTSYIKEEPISCEGGNLRSTNIHTPTDHIQCTSTDIKEESVPCEGGNLTGTNIYTPPDDTQYTTDIMEESVLREGGNLRGTNIYTPSDHLQDTPTYIKDESVLLEEGNMADTSIYTSAGHTETHYTPHFMEKSGLFTGPDFYTSINLTQHSTTYTSKDSVSCEGRNLYSHTDHAKTQYTPPYVENNVVGTTSTSSKNTSPFLTITDYQNNLNDVSDSVDHHAHMVNLNLHHKVHEGSKSVCLECGKCFKRRSQLKIHQRIHTGEKPYSCSECGKCFTRRTQLVVHQKIHRGEKPFACSECDKFFTSNSNLVIHLRTHTGEKPYSCSYCGKGFTRKSQLNIHQRIHTGEKPYSCLECGKCFTQYAQLATHQIIHTGEKSFACSECGKCFTTNSNRIRHQLTHSREKVFSCSECGMGFEQKTSLDIHMGFHMAEKNYGVSLM